MKYRKVLTLRHPEEEVDGFPYRLLHWQPALNDCLGVYGQFERDKCTHRAIIVKSSKGFNVFTDGKDLRQKEKNYRSPYKE